MNTKLKNTAKYTTGALLGAGVLNNYYPDEVQTTLGTTVGFVEGILEKTGEFVQEGIQTIIDGSVSLTDSILDIPWDTEVAIGNAAPFIAPTLIGARGGYKLADLISKESKVLKGFGTVVGAGVGIGITGTALAKYLVGGATIYYGCKLGKGVINKLRKK